MTRVTTELIGWMAATVLLATMGRKSTPNGATVLRRVYRSGFSLANVRLIGLCDVQLAAPVLANGSISVIQKRAGA
jgi:hypothetical protein